MTSRDDFDRLLSAWFEGDAPRVEPEHLLGQVLAQTARTPRRRTWRLLEGLSSMQATLQIPAPPRGLILLPVVLLLALVAIALVAVGSERRLRHRSGWPGRPDRLPARRRHHPRQHGRFGSDRPRQRPDVRLRADLVPRRIAPRLLVGGGLDKPATLVVVRPDGSDPIEVVRDVIAPSTGSRGHRTGAGSPTRPRSASRSGS